MLLYRLSFESAYSKRDKEIADPGIGALQHFHIIRPLTGHAILWILSSAGVGLLPNTGDHFFQSFQGIQIVCRQGGAELCEFLFDFKNKNALTERSSPCDTPQLVQPLVPAALNNIVHIRWDEKE